MADKAKPQKLDESFIRASPENQRAFAEFWGSDYKSMRFTGFWAGASDDGTMVGIMMRTHGQELRASFTFEEIAVVQANLVAAIAAAVDRMMDASKGPKGN